MVKKCLKFKTFLDYSSNYNNIPLFLCSAHFEIYFCLKKYISIIVIIIPTAFVLFIFVRKMNKLFNTIN